MDKKDLIDGYNDNIERVEILLRITRFCNQKCLFCSVDVDQSTMYSYQEVVSEIDTISQRHVGKVIEFTLTGGEPTLHPDFPQILKYLYERGFYIKLQTNAVFFGNQKNFERVKKYLPKVDFFISFHSHIEKLYDYITQSKGQFKLAVKGIENILGVVDVELNFVINAVNYKYMKQYFYFLGNHFGDANNFTVNISSLTNISKYGYGKSMLVSFENIKKYINMSQSVVEHYNISLRPSFGGPCDIPFCIAKDLFYYQDIFYKIDEHMNDRQKLAGCKSCKYDSYCSGILKLYIQKYGEQEFLPIPA